MQRFVFLVGLMSWTVLTLAAHVSAQTKVMYRDAAKKDSRPEANGDIQVETPAEIKIKTGIGTIRTIAVGDILDVQYSVTGDAKAHWNRAWTAEWSTAQKAKPGTDEHRAALKVVLKEYQALQPKVAGNKDGERQVRYKIAMLTATLAESNKDEMKAAAGLLDTFYKAYPSGWQVVNSINELSRLYLALGEFEKAAGVFDALKKVAGVSPETKADCDLKVADLLIKARKHGEAEVRLNDILKTMPATNPLYEPLKMKRILCKANNAEKFKEAVIDLKKLKDTTKDPGRLALVYNTLGDVYMMNNQPKDALWEYLWVDMHYNQDRNEHIRAVTQLIQVFKELREPNRSKEFAMRLERLKSQ